MDTFAKLPLEERKPYFEQAAAEMLIRPQFVEKDFWVCWALRLLFTLSGVGEHLIFKGGTSLSKAYHIIERFSEDIDITVSREFLGFGGDHDPEHAPSKKKQNAWLDDLRVACRKFVANELQTTLQERAKEELGGAEFSLSLDVADPDAQTLLFQYPSCWEELPGSYVGHSVKIELGARSDTWPSTYLNIQPYVAERIPKAIKIADCAVNVLAKERTFWEKAALLHEENCRQTDKPIKPRTSRHYSDLARMIEAGVGDSVLSDMRLFERVVEHRRVFFRYSWVDYEKMRPGSFHILPRPARVAEWQADYKAMEEMFFQTPPEFSKLLATIEQFERKLNTM
jgi:hypothetical protein